MNKYTVKAISSTGDEIAFLKLIRKELIDLGGGKITCNQTEKDIQDSYAAGTRITLEFLILNVYILKIKVNDFSSLQTSNYGTDLYWEIIQKNNVFTSGSSRIVFANSNQSGQYYYNSKSTRTINIRLAHCKDGIYFCLLSYNFDTTYMIPGVLIVKLNGDKVFSTIPHIWGGSYPYQNGVSPFINTCFFKENDSNWIPVVKLDRLGYIYNTNNRSEIEVLQNKMFKILNSGLLGVAVPELYDCSASPNTFSVYEIGSNNYLALDSYTLLKLEEEQNLQQQQEGEQT